MIIQCDHCDTRFRMADEKMRPDGVKIRCAKCKQVFLALPPQEPEDAPPEAPEQIPARPPVSEKDEAFPAATAAATAPTEDSDEEPDFDWGEEEQPAEPAPESETSFADLGLEPQPPSPEETFQDEDFSLGELEAPAETGDEEQEQSAAGLDDGTFGDIDFGIADYEDEDDFRAADLDDTDRPQTGAIEPTADLPENGEDFSGFAFADEESGVDPEEEERFGLALDEEDAFAEDDLAASRPAEDEEDFFGLETAGDQEDTLPPDQDAQAGQKSPSTDFPAVDIEESPEAGGGLALESAAALDSGEREHGGTGLPAQPPRPRRSPVATLMVFFLGLLILLTAVTGYLFWKEGPQSFERLLQSLTGGQSAQQGEARGRIELSQYQAGFTTNAEAGELFFINGQAVNKYNEGRSSIQVKGVVYNPAGKPVLQQTVFCGNPLDEEKLQALPYAKIEEAMNNQFGSSLSNLNLAPGASIPFTIVFRNLPQEMAEFTVEVVDSRPASATQ